MRKCQCVCSFMPIYPPPLGACLDTTLASHLRLTVAPEILILPSDLTTFAKALPTASPDSPQCLCINPGRLTKGQSSGTFAHVYIAASSREQSITSNCKVQIRKIWVQIGWNGSCQCKLMHLLCLPIESEFENTVQSQLTHACWWLCSYRLCPEKA